MKPLGSLIIIAAMSLGAQPQPDMAAACPTSLKALLALARSAPAEFSADAMIEIARSSLVSSSREKLALLEEASRRAAGAQEKVGLQWAYGGGPYSETHTAFIRGMDAVSLQARVVRAASDIDARTASRLFAEISLPLPPISDCRVGEVYDLSIYYKVFLYLLNATKEAGGDMEALLTQAVGAMRSSAQVQGLAQALTAYKGDPKDISQAAVAFGSRLAQIDNDSPSFSASFQRAIPAIGALASAFPRASKERRALVEGARAWVLNGAGRGVCAPSERITVINGREVPATWTSPADLFDKKVGPLTSESLGLKRSDSGPLIFKEHPSNPRYSGVFTALRNEQVLLRNDDFKESPRWKSEFEKFISQVMGWSANGEDPASYYLERSNLLQSSLLMMSRPRANFSTAVIPIPRVEDSLRTRLERALLDLFQGPYASDLLKNRRIIWFGPVASLSLSPWRDDSQDQQEMNGILAKAQSPLLSLYGGLGMCAGATARSNSRDFRSVR